jgi:hypothetical protein
MSEISDFMEELVKQFEITPATLQTFGSRYDAILAFYLRRLEDEQVKDVELMWILKTRPIEEFVPSIQKVADKLWLGLRWSSSPDVDGPYDERGLDVLSAALERTQSEEIRLRVAKALILANAFAPRDQSFELVPMDTMYDMLALLTEAQRIRILRETLYLIDVVPKTGTMDDLRRLPHLLQIMKDWVQLAYQYLDKEAAYGFAYDLVAAIPPRYLIAETLNEIGQALPVDHTLRLFEGFIPFTHFGARKWEEDARRVTRKILLDLRKRKLPPSDLERVSAWIEKRIASERLPVASADKIPAFARFFAASRVGESITGESIEGSFDLRPEGSIYVIFKYLAGQWTEIARFQVGLDQEIEWFRWNWRFRVKQWFGLVN